MSAEKIMQVMDVHRWKSMGVSSVQCECGEVCYGDESLTQFPADEAFRRHVADEVMKAIHDPYDNHDRRILIDAYDGTVGHEVGVIQCPHRIGLSFVTDNYLMRLPCQCNDKSLIVGKVVWGQPIRDGMERPE